MKAILVTGSSGFLGIKVVEHALSQGYKVFGVDIRHPINRPEGDFEFTLVDVNQMETKLNQKIDFIVHFKRLMISPMVHSINHLNGTRFASFLSKPSMAWATVSISIVLE